MGSDEPVVGSSEMRRLEDRIRDLERLLGRKTMEIEILREALAKSESKKTELAALVATEGRFPMKTVAETLGVARSNLHDKVRQAARFLSQAGRHLLARNFVEHTILAPCLKKIPHEGRGGKNGD